MTIQPAFSLVIRDGRDLNYHGTDWPQSACIKLHQSRHVLRLQVHGRSRETAAGRLVPKLEFAQGLALDGWLPSVTVTQLTLIGF